MITKNKRNFPICAGIGNKVFPQKHRIGVVHFMVLLHLLHITKMSYEIYTFFVSHTHTLRTYVWQTLLSSYIDLVRFGGVPDTI